jgi:hypothetical protein
MCYQSFPEDDLEIGKSYVFPLKQIDLANPDDALGLMIVSDKTVPIHKMYRLPVCSHNALLLDGQGLYTNELTPDGGRKIDYYMPLFLVRVLLPFGLLSTWGIIAAIVIAASVTAAFIVRKRRRKATHAV